MRCCRSFLDVVSRRKPWDVRSLHQTELRRCLNVPELVGIGTGSCLGLGIFVTVAHVTKVNAGPAAVLSVLFASLLALLSGLCHMELITRLPRAGTTYSFCYFTLGELLAFVMGWSSILEHSLNGAIAAKAAWQYVEYMVNVTVTKNDSLLASPAPTLAPDPDFFACCLVVAVVFIGFITIKRYAVINIIITCMSGVVVMAFICVGLLHVQSDNWNSGQGFFAKGTFGIITASSLLMSTFSCINILCSCVEESRSPCQSLPSSFGFVIAITSTVLFLATAALTLASPWQRLADDAALARAYEDKGIFAANYVIGVGAVLGLLPVVLGSFLHPCRVLYSMSEDRLMPKLFSKLAYNGVPLCPHFITGAIVAQCALFLDFTAIIEMSSIVTILQFISSSIILLFVRYQPLPVGICREYSDLDAPESSAAVLQSAEQSITDFEKKKPKLVLFSNGDCKLEHDTGSLFDDVSTTKTSVDTSNATTKDAIPSLRTSKRMSVSAKAWNEAPQETNPCADHAMQTLTPLTNRRSKSIASVDKQAYGSHRNHRQATERDSLCCSTAPGESVEIADWDRDGVRGTTGRIRDRNFGSIRSLASSTSSSMVVLSSCAPTHADDQTWKYTRYFLLTYISSSTCLTITLWVWPDSISGAWWAVSLLCLSLVLMLISAVCIVRQPQNASPLYFKAPYAPLVPLLAMTGNMILLAALPFLSWFRFALWLCLGLAIYAFYSHRHSVHRSSDDQEVVLFDISQLQSAASRGD